MKTDEIKLWNAYWESRSIPDRNRLVEYYIPQVRKIANRLRFNLSTEVDFEDLVQAGFFGLINAIETFNPSMGTFSARCSVRARGSMVDHLRSIDPLTRTQRRRVVAANEVRRKIYVTEGRRASDEDIQKVTGQSIDCPLDRKPVRLNFDGGKGDNDEAGAWGLLIADPKQNVFRDIESRDLFASTLKKLTRAKKLLMILHYKHQMDFAEIGRVLGYSQSRAWQLHNEVIRSMVGELSRTKS